MRTNSIVSITITLTLTLTLLAVSQQAWSGDEDWQLPMDAFDAVMDAEVVAPRPLDELHTNSALDSPYLWGHPEFDYVRPLHARGGAWPYHWEIVSGPPGTTIGEFPVADSNGIVEVDPEQYSMLHVPAQPEGTVSSVVVRMRDQNWNRGQHPTGEHLIELEITWQADRWLIVAPDGDPGGQGTIDDPLQGDAFWEAIVNDQYSNRLVLLRGGDYGVIDRDISLNANRPSVLLAAPGETPVVRELFLQTSTPDASIMGLTFDQPFERYNQYFIRVWSTAPRQTFTSNTFIGLTPGSQPGNGDGQDNPAGIMTTNPGNGNRREFLTIARNHFTGFVGSRVNFAAFITYGNSRSVMEMNRLSDSQVMEGFFIKGSHYFTTVRANVADADVHFSNSRGGLTAMHLPGLSDDEPPITGWVEHCWNRVPSGNIALIDRAANLDQMVPNPSFLYRNHSNGVLTHRMQREMVPWHVFNNLTMGEYGTSHDRPTGRWPSAIGTWPVQNGNAHILHDLYVDGRLTGSAERLEGFKGSRVLNSIEPWPEQAGVEGIDNLASFQALASDTLPVTIGPAGRNRMLVVVSYQSGGNGRGQGYHLDGVYGQVAIHNPFERNNIIVSFFDDRLLPREAGDFTLHSEQPGTESAFAIYAEGVAQEAPRTAFYNGEDISGTLQMSHGSDDELVVYGALPLDALDLTPLPGQHQVLAGNEEAAHHGLWRLGSQDSIGVTETFEGIVSAAAFRPAFEQPIFHDRFQH